MDTLTLTKDDIQPCSGGWPSLRVQEWDHAQRPDLKIHLSYYMGRDVQPLAFISIINKATGKTAPEQKNIPCQLDRFANHAPSEFEVCAEIARAIPFD